MIIAKKLRFFQQKIKIFENKILLLKAYISEISTKKTAFLIEYLFYL